MGAWWMQTCLILEEADDGWAQLSPMQLLCKKQNSVSASKGLPNYMTKRDKTKMIIHFTFILHTRVVHQVQSFDC